MTQEEYRKMIPDPTPETEFLLAQDERPRAVDSAVHRLLRGVSSIPGSTAQGAARTRSSGFQTSGNGTLYSYMINYRPAPGFEADAPYAIAVIQLEEGPRMMGNIVGIENTPEKSRAGHAAQGDLYRRHRRHSHPQLGTGLAGHPTPKEKQKMSLRYKTAIVGASETTQLGVIPDVSETQLHIDAAMKRHAGRGVSTRARSTAYLPP